MKTLIKLAALSCLLIPGLSHADDISFTYAEAAAINLDADVVGSEIGIALTGSVGLTDHFYLFGEYQQADVDLGSFDVDISSFELGLGFHLGLGDIVQGLVEVGAGTAEVGNFDDEGYVVKVGVRVAPTENIELGARLGYEDLGGNIDGGIGEFNLLWKPGRVFGINFKAELGDGVDVFGVGVRASF